VYDISLGIRKSFAPLTMKLHECLRQNLTRKVEVVGHKLYTGICLSYGVFNDLLTRKVNTVRQD